MYDCEDGGGAKYETVRRSHFVLTARRSLMGKSRIRISKYERTTANDISYRGPLSYRHLLIIGWICISFKVLDMLISLGTSIDPNQQKWVLTLGRVAGFLGDFALPLFLIANFAIILDKKKTYRQQLIKFGGLSLGVVLLFIIIKEHYVVGIVTAALGNRADAGRLVDEMIYKSAMTGSLIFNLFVDLFMCTLFMFFLEYEPKTHFRGKKLRLFRAMAMLPVLYEAGALALRIIMVMTGLKPSYIVYPFLTTKPFMSFVLFIILALHIKFDESRFRKRDKNPEDFEEYTRTNDHSLRFSVFTSIMILITGLIDLLVYVLSSVFLTYTTVGADMSAPLTQEAENALDEVMTTAMQVVGAWRFGEHFKMIPLISLILLFSYTKNHKNERVDLFIPIGGVALAFLVGIEGTYQGIVMNLPILMEKITELASQFLG